MRLLTVIFFLVLVLVAGFPSQGFALTISNEGDEPMGIMLYQVEEGGKHPAYAKIIAPGGTLEHEPVIAGPYMISALLIETKREFELVDLQADDKVVFNGEDLVRL